MKPEHADYFMILAGDIGGTKTRLGLFDPTTAATPLAVEVYRSSEHASLEVIVDQFRAQHSVAVRLACFGVAGPVRDNRCVATNLPWVVDGARLAQRLGIAEAWVINDLEANAYGIALLTPQDIVELHPGTPAARGNAAVIAAGTGLGQAAMFWDGRRHHPFASEGGHGSFAPSNELEIELLRWLQQQWEHVSWERVLSGPGLENIYRFLRDTGRGSEPEWLRQQMQAGDAPAIISRLALEHGSELCMAALDCFVRLYGSAAGNFALMVMATGGVYLSGNIAVKNLVKLRDGSFTSTFVDKGRLRPVLESIAVRVILAENVNLLGTVRCAMVRGVLLPEDQAAG